MAIKWIVIALCTLLVGNTQAESSSKSYRSGFSSSRSTTPSKSAAPQNTQRSESKKTSFGTFGSAKKTDAQTAPSQSASNKSMSRAAEKNQALKTMNEREARARQSASNIYIPNTKPYQNQQAGPDPYRQQNRDTDRSFGQSMAGSVLGSMLGNSMSRSNQPQSQPQNQQTPVQGKKPESSSGWLGVFFFALIVFVIAFLILAVFLRKKAKPQNYTLGD